MKNQEHIEYTYKHRKIVMYLANKYVKEDAVLKQIQNHDIDKLFMYLFYNKINKKNYILFFPYIIYYLN